MKLKALAASLAAIGMAHAGIASAESERELAAMKVTADQDKPVQQRTELGKLTEYTPISGVVVEREELDHLQLVNNLLELGKRVPSISMVRNMRIPEGGKNYTENRVDGLRVSYTSNTSLLDEVDGSMIERFEVITGPGSALYGSGALGGTLSVFTRMPPRDFEAKVTQEAGSWGFSRTGGSVGTSTADGSWGFLINASTMDNEGWRRNLVSGTSDSAEEHKDGLAFRVQFRPSGTTKISLGVDRLKYDYQLAGPIPLNKTEADKVKNASINGIGLRSVYWDNDWAATVPGSFGRAIDEYETYTLNLQQMVGERGEFSLAYSHREDDGLAYGAAGSGGSRNVICDGLGGAGTTVNCNTYNSYRPGTQNTVDAKGTNTLKKSSVAVHSWRPMYRHDFDLAKSTLYVGWERVDVKTDSATYNNIYTARDAQKGAWGVGTMTATGQGSVVMEKNETPFVHFEFSPVDKLRLHLGGRFDKITYETDDRTSANKDPKKTYQRDIFKSGATYELTGNHLIWGSLAETFNAPNSSTLLDTDPGKAGNVIGDTTLKPETSLTKEIGMRGTFTGASLHYDVTLYNTYNRGFIVLRDCTATEATALNNGASCSINENAGALTARGLESMFDWEVSNWLNLGATYTYARAFYNSYKTTTYDYSGNSYQAMPRQRLNLRLGFKPAPGWLVELEGDHVASYYTTNKNVSQYSRPDLYNLRASYRGKQWSFWLHALNLGDKKYATRVGESTIAGTTVMAVSAGQGNSGTYTPLTLRAGVSYRF